MEYVWYGLIVLIGVVALLLTIASIRAVWLEVSPVKVEVPSIDPHQRDLYGLRLAKLLQEKTLSHREGQSIEPFLRLQSHLKEFFPTLFRQVEEQVFPSGAFVWKWKGIDPVAKPLVIMAHQDVVPAEESGWSYPPFGGVIEHHTLYGRGAMDTKNTLFAFLQAAEELAESGFQPEVTIYFCSSTDEEISGGGAKTTVEWLKAQNIEPAIVLDEGGAVISQALPTACKPLALIGILEKGYVNFRVVARSAGGHASMPKKNSPLARLAKFMVAIEKKYPLKTQMMPEVQKLFETAAPSMSFLYRFLFGNMWLFKGLLTRLLPKINPYGRALLSTTIAFTMIKGSEAENVIPSEAVLTCNVRTHPNQGIDSTKKALDRIAKKYQLELCVDEGRDASMKTNTGHPGYQYLSSIIQKQYPDALVSPYIMLGGTDSREYCAISDCVLRFSPMRTTNEELKKIHGIDESINLNELAQTVLFFKTYIQEYHP